MNTTKKIKTSQGIVVALLLLLCQYTKAQKTIKEAYTQLTTEEYTAAIDSTKKNKLDGKYYAREFKNTKLIGIHKIEFKNGKKYGEWLHFSISGKDGSLDLSSIGNYDYNLEEGYFYNSDHATAFSEEGYYERGLKEGLWYVTKGKTKEKINYKYGKKHGDYWRQEPSGDIIEGAYKKDRKQDNWTIKDPSGGIKPYGQVVSEDPAPSSPTKTGIQTIQGIVQKPNGTIAPIAVVKLQLSESSCAYAFSDFEGKFNMEIDMAKIDPTSYFEIVIEGFPIKKFSFSSFSDQGIIKLGDEGNKVSYDEYRNYYTAMKDCHL